MPTTDSYELGRSHREIAASLGIANSTVSDCVRRASATGLKDLAKLPLDATVQLLPPRLG